jgi:hypothetical protein
VFVPSALTGSSTGIHNYILRLVQVFLVTVEADRMVNFDVTPVLAHLWMVHARVSSQDFLQERVAIDSTVS